jgi:hypothetical protein
MGIDGRIFPVCIKPAEATAKGKKVHTDHMFAEDWFPIQVKQMDKGGRPDIGAFEAVMQGDGMRPIHIGGQKRTRESRPGCTFRADPSLTVGALIKSAPTPNTMMDAAGGGPGYDSPV